MRSLFAVIVLGLALFSGARADDPTPAQTLLQATQTDVQKNGVMAVAAHAADLEQALANAHQNLTVVNGETGPVVFLTDGMAETLIAMAMSGTDSPYKGRQLQTVENPYPSMSLYLGSYYNEIGKFEDAARVLDLGLKADAFSDMKLGEHRPYLLAERGAALNQLHRQADALASYEDALEGTDLPAHLHGVILRGKGYALTDLGRLDEAEAAYKESLTVEPDNPNALRELDYIAKLKAGAQPTSGSLQPLQKPAP